MTDLRKVERDEKGRPRKKDPGEVSLPWDTERSARSAEAKDPGPTLQGLGASAH